MDQNKAIEPYEMRTTFRASIVDEIEKNKFYIKKRTIY